jgi:hypothetical protein
MKKNRLLLLTVPVVLIVSSALFYFVWLRYRPIEQEPSSASFVLGTLYGRIADSFAQSDIDGVLIEVHDSKPFSHEKLTALTNSSGLWEVKNVNLTEPIFVSASMKGYYPLLGATRSVEKEMEGVYSFGLLGLFRVSTNFAFSVSRWVSQSGPIQVVPLQNGQELTVPRKEPLVLAVGLENHDETAILGQDTRYVNTVNIWVFPMEDTVSCDFGGNSTTGRGEWKFSPLALHQVVNGVYGLSNVTTLAVMRFQEIGSYSVFIRYQDNYETYTAMTIHVNVSNP